MGEQNKNPEGDRVRRVPLFDFERAIDRQIREAVERGDFDNLSGAGKPQNLRRDPGVPHDWELAHNMLKNAGFAPDWIETRKDIDKQREKLFAPLQRFTKNPPRGASERQAVLDKLTTEFRKGATELNRLIDIYNLKAPTPQVHLHRIRIDHEIENFLSANK